MSFRAEVAGRFAREALQDSGGEVCAVFRRSFYLRCAGERYACVGDASVGNGPLNAVVADLVVPRLGDRLAVSLNQSKTWSPPQPLSAFPRMNELVEKARH